MPTQELQARLRSLSSSAPNRMAVRALDAAHGARALTYLQLDRAADRLAAALRDAGITSGSRVVLGFGNTPECIAAVYGCLRAGVAAVPLDPSATQRDLRGAYALLEPAATIVDARSSAALREVCSEHSCRLLHVADTLQHDAAAPSAAAAGGEPGPSQPSDAGLIMYTSGTTGTAKGVVLSRSGLATKLDALNTWLGIDETFTTLCVLPTYFGHGLIANCLTTLYAGGTLVMGPPFNLDILGDFHRLLREHEITNFSSVPTLVRLLFERSESEHWPEAPSLRFATCASAPLRPQEICAFERQFKAPLLNCYGLTETSSWSTCSKIVGRDLAAVGWPVGCSIRVVDASGTVCGPGVRGELQISGPSVMTAYFRDPIQTASALQAGWFSTGDLGEIDATGQVFVRARIKDMIIRAGKNIFPSEIDAALARHPAIAEVCAFGLPDPLLGETVAACAVLRDGAQASERQLLAYAREQLADYKCPERIIVVSSIPKTTRGKVRRADVRDLYLNERPL